MLEVRNIKLFISPHKAEAVIITCCRCSYCKLLLQGNIGFYYSITSHRVRSFPCFFLLWSWPSLGVVSQKEEFFPGIWEWSYNNLGWAFTRSFQLYLPEFSSSFTRFTQWTTMTWKLCEERRGLGRIRFGAGGTFSCLYARKSITPWFSYCFLKGNREKSGKNPQNTKNPQKPHVLSLGNPGKILILSQCTARNTNVHPRYRNILCSFQYFIEI